MHMFIYKICCTYSKYVTMTSLNPNILKMLEIITLR